MNFKQKKDMKRIITKMYLCLLAFCIAGGISAQYDRGHSIQNH